ncbi:MAG: tRNA pseudouridine(13) synthase TruD [bacterium]
MQDTLFSFKQKSQDFVVQEELPFLLSGRGDVFFVFFEKRNLNTMDVVNHLCSAFNISRLTLGIAGLKDKRAITKQWICIYKSALKKL